MSHQSKLHSPTLSTTSSFDYVQSLSSSVTFSEPTNVLDGEGSEDEIVWTVSRQEASRVCLSESDLEFTDGNGYSSDEDLVLISRHKPSDIRSAEGYSVPVATESKLGEDSEKLIKRIESLKLKDSTEEAERKRERRKAAAKKRRSRRKAVRKFQSSPAANSATGSTCTSSASIRLDSKPSKSGEDNHTYPSSPLGLGARSLIDDSSDRLSVADESESPLSKYEEASRFISSFLSNPQIKNNAGYRLTLLQSLIIELGLATSQLPTTLTSAKAYLKSKAFLNIREYLAVRGQGPDAMQKLLHPSKSSLIRAIRKNKNPASLKWVKDHGLQVLLVSRIH
ncbi:hypothetical protein BDQ17DRAFT_1056714 [Cyathus striatus]|nr:hypothetical protein BDQ17DRAFT_1056714 [Cyathus striatus]